MERRIAVIGAGMNGLITCKYLLERGFHPIVLEADGSIGGLWKRTLESTKLQNNRQSFCFSDFPWPSYVQEMNPGHTQVLEYFELYAQHFGIMPYIRFNTKVISLAYIGESDLEIESWEKWGGTGKPFGSKGKWHIEVQDTKTCSIEVIEVEFVVFCIGRFSGLANIPDFPAGQGPEVFSGQVMHSMDYSALDKSTAAKLIKGKRVTVIGSLKSAMDIAAECAEANGIDNPCTMIQRNPHWGLLSEKIWGVNLGYFCTNRFSELLVHKPGEPFLLSCISTLLSPLRLAMSKFVESYLKWKLPLKKYNVIPDHSFHQHASSCTLVILPKNFYDKVEEGSIVLKRSKNIRFCREGLVVEGEPEPLKTDLVIFATGYKGDQKLKTIFKSPTFQNLIVASPTSTVPLYSLSNIYTSEVTCQWLAHFLDGNIQLPDIRDMEREVAMWKEYMKQYAGSNYKRSCIGAVHVWYNDQLCKDIGCNHKRKKGFIKEWFEPYGPRDYARLATPSK
ncbi:Flavin monooxygenase-like [Dillenia turbinata]|uniref:Flavin-containing monooxygenase n=1 Tax=Dillenia turbinata TaxID=194707 RepID=A0AAN8W2S1_9MAGN